MGRNNKDFRDWAIDAAYAQGAKNYNVKEWADTLRSENSSHERAKQLRELRDDYGDDYGDSH